MKEIAFIDLEASGLGARSWPIEVGWCFTGGKPQSFLIKPASDWAMEAWDEKAHALHGVARKVLDMQGEELKTVCTALNAALTGHTVYSDAPDWDGFWLYRLFESGGAKFAGLFVYETVKCDYASSCCDCRNQCGNCAHLVLLRLSRRRSKSKSGPHRPALSGIQHCLYVDQRRQMKRLSITAR